MLSIKETSSLSFNLKTNLVLRSKRDYTISYAVSGLSFRAVIPGPDKFWALELEKGAYVKLNILNSMTQYEIVKA